MENIKVDINYSLKKFLNSGLTESDIENYKSKAQNGLLKLIQLHSNGEVGFPDVVNQNISEIKDFAKKTLGKYNDLIVIGIGGSSLGIEAVCEALLPYGYNALSYSERGCFPRIWVLDNVDPFKKKSILRHCKAEDTLVCVISKSGSTVETIFNFVYVYNWLKENLRKNLNEHLIFITDPEKGFLKKFGNENKIKMFDIPKNIGGRFSVFTPVGLLPFALLGIEIDRLLAGAKNFIDEGINKCLLLSAIYMYFIENSKNINVVMPYTSRLGKFVEWFCQLWAESLGKAANNKGETVNFGTTPLKSIGSVDQHSLLQLFKEGPNDKHFTFIEVLNHQFDNKCVDVFDDSLSYFKNVSLGQLINYELHSTELVLRKAGRPSIKIIMDLIDEYNIGYLMMMYMYIVSIIGLANDINPFDQPGVEEGKKYTNALLGRKEFIDFKKDFEQEYLKLDEYII
ncbi:glucose-6-phosphate isomerase [Deferribacter thermophilus]|uniref:glucose-6-phosphate isomerase n=1 Tax=Deferribacter thermophilus TaxID=53573 RepID=UPI003C1A1509